MALSTYAELQASIADWWHHDQPSVVVDAIRIAESRFNRRLRAKRQEVGLSDTVINASYQIAIPSNTLAVKALWRVEGTQKTYLEAAPLQEVESWQASGKLAGFYHFGTTFEFDGTGTVGGILIRDIPALSTNSTNWVLTNYPEAYLYGALTECMKWSRDSEGALMYETLFVAQMAEIQRIENADGYSGPIRVRSGTNGP